MEEYFGRVDLGFHEGREFFSTWQIARVCTRVDSTHDIRTTLGLLFHLLL